MERPRCNYSPSPFIAVFRPRQASVRERANDSTCRASAVFHNWQGAACLGTAVSLCCLSSARNNSLHHTSSAATPTIAPPASPARPHTPTDQTPRLQIEPRITPATTSGFVPAPAPALPSARVRHWPPPSKPLREPLCPCAPTSSVFFPRSPALLSSTLQPSIEPPPLHQTRARAGGMSEHDAPSDRQSWYAHTLLFKRQWH